MNLVQKYAEEVEHLAVVRLDLSNALNKLTIAEQDLNVAKAKAEKLFIDEVANGKPKALGSNAEDRNRALLLAVEDNYEYVLARKNMRKIQDEASNLRAEKDSIEDKLKLLALESDAQLRDAIREVSGLLTPVLGRQDN